MAFTSALSALLLLSVAATATSFNLASFSKQVTCPEECFPTRRQAVFDCFPRMMGCRPQACTGEGEMGFKCGAFVKPGGGPPQPMSCPARCFRREEVATFVCSRAPLMALGCVVEGCTNSRTGMAGFACATPATPIVA